MDVLLPQIPQPPQPARLLTGQIPPAELGRWPREISSERLDLGRIMPRFPVISIFAMIRTALAIVPAWAAPVVPLGLLISRTSPG